MYGSLVGLRRPVLLRTYVIVSTFMWSSLYLRDILSQHYRPLHTTMTHAVDMQTRCTLVQCRTPREVRYLSSKANSFPRSIVFPGAIAFSTHAKPPHGRPLSENTLHSFSSARKTNTHESTRQLAHPQIFTTLFRVGRAGEN